MKEKIAAAVLCIFIIFLIGCNSPGAIEDSGMITGIYNDEITSHGSQHLSCFLEKDDGSCYELIDFHPRAVKKIPDLQSGERAWIRCRNYRRDGNRFLGGTMEIHCHPDKIHTVPEKKYILRTIIFVNINFSN